MSAAPAHNIRPRSIWSPTAPSAYAHTMTSLPYVNFPGNAAEILDYWMGLFGGQLDLKRYDDMPNLDEFPFTPPPGAVAHARLTGGDLDVCGGDDLSTDADPSIASTLYSFSLTLDSPERAQQIRERVLADGGADNVAFEQAPWGDWYGQVADRYGAVFHLSVPVGQG